MDGISACHYSTSCWCTNTLHIIVVENYSTISQSIQVWSWNLLRTMKTQIIPSLKEQQKVKQWSKKQFQVKNGTVKVKPKKVLPQNKTCTDDPNAWFQNDCMRIGQAIFLTIRKLT